MNLITLYVMRSKKKIIKFAEKNQYFQPRELVKKKKHRSYNDEYISYYAQRKQTCLLSYSILKFIENSAEENKRFKKLNLFTLIIMEIFKRTKINFDLAFVFLSFGAIPLFAVINSILTK